MSWVVLAAMVGWAVGVTLVGIGGWIWWRAAKLSFGDGCVPKCNLGTRGARGERVVVRRSVPMDDDRIRMALSQLGEDHPAWIAMNQVLQEQIDNAVAQVSAPQMSGEYGPLAHTAGGIEWLRAAQMALMDARDGRRSEHR